jgi:Zn-dependent peptidase ImmA (M78 family)
MAYDHLKIAQKLLRSRNNMGLDKIEVSNLTGIDVDRIEALESGIVEPSGDEILILADVYKEDFRYFISNQNLSSAETVDELYRLNGSITKIDKQAIQSFIFHSANEQSLFDSLGKKNEVFVSPSINNERVWKSDGIKVAQALRQFLGYKNMDAYRNLYYEFRRIGLHIFRVKLQDSNLSGLFVKHPIADKCVLVNFDDNLYRQNFTLCHEVGHALMDGSNYNVSYQAQKDYREYRANAFASEFLMPQAVIKQINPSSLTPENVVRYATQFRVNVQAFLIALENAGVITPDKRAEYDGMRLKVPRNEQVDYELEDLTDYLKDSYKMMFERGITPYYVRLCYEAYENGVITVDRMSEILDISLYELPSFLDTLKLKLNNGDSL